MGEKTFHVSVTSSSQGINVKPESGGQSINTTVSVTSQKNININAATKQNPIGATSDTGLYYSQLSKNWAIGEGLIQNEDYSSKTWAAESKSSADLSKMYSEAASLDYNNLSDTINQYNEQISGVVAEGINTIETTKTEASEYVETTANESIAEVNQAKEQAIKDFNKASDKVNYLFVMSIGTIGFSPFPIDETKGLRRILNGQIIIQEQFTGFVKWLKENIELYPQMACTEEQWQATVTMSAFGQCGKFVIDDEAGTIRLPKITGFIQGLTDLASLGELVEAGLPTISHTHTRGTMDIKGSFASGQGNAGGVARFATSGASYSGAFYLGTATSGMVLNETGNAWQGAALQFQASKNWTGETSANSVVPAVYGKSTTVQPEAIRYPYFIQVATGAETEDNIINEIELNNPFSLLDYKYSEYELNNISWLRSNGQYNSKAIYPAVYDLLLKEYNSPDRFATFNKNAFTVVGSPTITDDGVVSRFSESDYINISSIDVANKDFEINLGEVITPNDVNTIGAVISSQSRTDNVFSIGVLYNNFYIGSNGFYFTTARTGIIQPNTKYYVKAGVSENYAYLDYSKDGVNFTRIQALLTNTYTKLLQKIGLAADNTAIWTGLFDLKQLSITVDGKEVFSGANYKVKLTSETFTDYDFVLNTADETFRLPIKTNNLNNSVDSLSLYFYVGETTQNANLINAGRIEEVVVGKVNRTGDTMTGSLHMRQPLYFKFSETLDFTDINHTSSGEDAGTITFTDKNNKMIGQITSYFNQYNNMVLRMTSRRDINGAEKLAQTSLYVDANGNANFTFPMCTTKATTTSSATTGRVAVVVQNYVSGTSWYRVWSDGWIEQGGSSAFSSKNTATITFAKKFASTPTINISGTFNEIAEIEVNALTTSNFTWILNTSRTGTIYYYACGY